MGIFDRLFGRKRAPDPGPAAAGDATIRLHDAYGREIGMTREQWRDHLLRPQVEASWNDADALAGLIVGALHDGLAADVESWRRREASRS